MSDTGSSPFVEQPRSILEEDSEFNLRQIVSNLQFQVSSLRTEKSLLQQDKQSMNDKYETLLTKKNAELVTLQNDFDYVFKQKDELQSKYDNTQQINKNNVGALSSELCETKDKYGELLDRNDELSSKYSKLYREHEQVKSNLQFQSSSSAQLDERLLHLQNENKDLYKTNDDLIEKLNVISDQLISKTNDKFMQTLQNQNVELQKTNNQLQSKVDQLLQNKTSVELLKSKNSSLTNKLDSLANVEEKYCKLEIENIELKNKFDTYFKTIADLIKTDETQTNESAVSNFMYQFKQLQNLNLVLQDKYNESATALNNYKTEYANLKQQNSELLPKIDLLNEALVTKQELIDKLERQKLLNVKEIEFLRESLKKMDEMHARQSKEKDNEKSTEQYMSNLEKLVDEYRTEINNLQNQLSSKTSSDISKFQPGSKRPRIIDDDLQNNFRSQVSGLEKENLKLLSTIKNLEYNNKALAEKLQSLEQLDSKKAELHVLQLKSNPASKDQIVKQQALDLLRKENQDLIQTFIKKESVIDMIPKSLFERQENDKFILQTKIDQLNKRINRLRDIYSQKSRDILSVISKFFGYTIEFLPSPINPNDLSSRIKLVSKYMINKDESGNAYLILDVNSKSLKANGNLEFNTLCEDLVTDWVKDKDQIPCFLSALNLSIYEKYVSGK